MFHISNLMKRLEAGNTQVDKALIACNNCSPGSLLPVFFHPVAKTTNRVLTFWHHGEVEVIVQAHPELTSELIKSLVGYSFCSF